MKTIDPDDFYNLLTAALSINDQLKLDIDHIEYEGGMNQAENFLELTNRLYWKYKHRKINHTHG